MYFSQPSCCIERQSISNYNYSAHKPPWLFKPHTVNSKQNGGNSEIAQFTGESLFFLQKQHETPLNIAGKHICASSKQGCKYKNYTLPNSSLTAILQKIIYTLSALRWTLYAVRYWATRQLTKNCGISPPIRILWPPIKYPITTNVYRIKEWYQWTINDCC